MICGVPTVLLRVWEKSECARAAGCGCSTWLALPLLPAGCFVSGLYLEGADWDTEAGCLIKSKPKVLVVELPILKIIPIEAHRLKLQVKASCRPPCAWPRAGTTAVREGVVGDS